MCLVINHLLTLPAIQAIGVVLVHVGAYRGEGDVCPAYGAPARQRGALVEVVVEHAAHTRCCAVWAAHDRAPTHVHVYVELLQKDLVRAAARAERALYPYRLEQLIQIWRNWLPFSIATPMHWAHSIALNRTGRTHQAPTQPNLR